MRVTRASPGTPLARSCTRCRIRKLLALRYGPRMRRGLATAACCLIAAPTAAAEVKQAQSVMPPGQSGFVSAPCLVDSAACDPHLTDQIPLFTDFQYKNSMLGQPGAEETPKAGVRIVRDAYGVPASLRRHRGRHVVGHGLRDRPGPPLPDRGLQARDDRDAQRDPRQGGPRGRHRRPARLLHAGRAGADDREPARRPPDALAGVRRRRQRLDRRGRTRTRPRCRPNTSRSAPRRSTRRCTRWPRSASSWRGRRPATTARSSRTCEAFQARRAEGVQPRVSAAHPGPVGNRAAAIRACSRRGPA